MKKMYLFMAVLGFVSITGCTTNTFHMRESNEESSCEQRARKVVEKRKPVEYYSKSTYIISREIIP